ncbi:undecaprenyl-diphosphatase [Maribacter vaceletii]|uniref:Undecaprenyl-diphosphatase n=1 Tax=Maribacter vaceletii TaxID=1206816 RepID=A0A495E5R7_9FLAO|nr:phosphatase PAP2 family protein [Maribacter vaceletii]RKR12268.1 undecaprenyl-diphosphatase [Maribacter vaceletii]
MLEELVQLDKTLFLQLNNLGTPIWDSFWLFITNKVNSIPLYVILLFVSYKQLGLKKTLLLLVTVGIMIGVTDQLANFFKYGVQRLRPCHDTEVNSLMRLVKSYCGGKYGYFSAHAANSFAVAIFFTNLLRSKIKYIAVFLLIWAAMVAYSRVYIGVHFPLDILTGTGIGLFLGWLFTKLYIFALQKFPI